MEGVMRSAIVILMTITLSAIVSGQLIKVGKCTCPEDIIVYRCTVNASSLGGFTIWRGTAFDCPGVQNRVLLRHNSYQNGGAFGQCGDAIVGRSLRVDPDFVYVSQLEINITANPELIGRTVECVYNPSGDTIVTINSTVIETEDSVPTPTDVELVNATSNLLSFAWKPVPSDCSTLRYVVESNCGACDTTSTMQTTVNCSFEKPSALGNVCMFSVRSMICRNISGSLTFPISVNLRVPSQPAIQRVIPTYGGGDGSKLQSLSITFNEVDSFNISKGIDGSPLYYEVLYSIGGVECGSQNILPSSCYLQICTAFFEVIAAACRYLSGDIDISVSAFNRLGSGLPSQLTLGGNNLPVGNGLGSAGVAAIIVAVILVVLALFTVAAIVIRSIILKFKQRQSDTAPDFELQGLIEERSSKTKEYQSVSAHITFSIEDRPDRLIEALRVLRKSDVNIKSIKICPSENNSEVIMKKVCIECYDFSDQNVDRIRKISDKNVLPDISVFDEAKSLRVLKDEEYDQRFMKVIEEVIRDIPGALCAILEMVVEECKHIVITDITLEPDSERNDDQRTAQEKDKCKLTHVMVKFFPELPTSWKEEYERKRSKCSYIEHDVRPDKYAKDLTTIL